MFVQLVILVIGLGLVSTQGTCNRAIPVSHTGVSSSISYEEFKQALGEVSSALSETLDARCQICGQRGDLDAIPRDCQDVLDLGYRTTGVYMIYPPRATSFKVRCDQLTDAGGWTVVQRRVSSSDFFRTWREYKDGFGDLNGNFWLGNDNIHTLTASGNYGLRVDLTAAGGEKGYAEYSTFYVGDESTNYRLTVSGYNGTIGDGMSAHNGMMFSTRDSNNDGHDCSAQFNGAWWYDACYVNGANLNAVYGNRYFIWLPWKGIYTISMTEMKIKKYI